MKERVRAAAVNLALVLAAVVVFLAALEVGLRWLGSEHGDWYASGPQRLRFLRDHVDRNSRRFRDDEFTPGPRPGVERILAVGDSFTFGDGIEDPEDTWPSVVEAELRERGLDCEVLNLGVPGTATAFQRRLLREIGYDLEPDRVVLGFVLNDPEPADANQEIVPRVLNPPLLPVSALDSALTRRSYAYAWLKGKKNRLLERAGAKPTYAEYVSGLYEDPVVWKTFRAEARGLVRESARRGVPVTVAVFPLFHDLESYSFGPAHRAVREVFRDAGADVVDLLDVFRATPTAELRVSRVNAHPNEKAHGLAGRAIAEHLLRGRSPSSGPTTERTTPYTGP